MRLNPYTREYEYIPDGEPHVFGDRVYIYGSHDRFAGEKFCMNDYVCYSASVHDLSDWRYEGVIYKKTEDPRMKDGSRELWAPDVVRGADGRYYLYYCPDGDFEAIGVAVCETPAGVYRFYGIVHDENGGEIGKRPGDTVQFDPGVFRDDDGRIFLYSGNGSRVKRDIGKLPKSSVVMELCADMVTIKTEPKRLLPVLGEADEKHSPSDFSGTDVKSFAGHEMFEASSIRKINGKYYLVYSSVALHELCYAVSDRPDGGYRYGGVLISNADVFQGKDERFKNAWGNNHGGIECIDGEYYIFYHRHTCRSNFSRQGCASKLTLHPDGSFAQAELTSTAFSEAPLPGVGDYPASCVCHLHRNFKQAISHPLAMGMRFPFLTQDEPDFDVARLDAGEQPPRQYITNFKNGSYALFRYFDLTETTRVAVRLRGKAKGKLLITAGEEGTVLGEAELKNSADWHKIEVLLTGDKAADHTEKGDELCIRFEGRGAIEILGFSLEKCR